MKKRISLLLLMVFSLSSWKPDKESWLFVIHGQSGKITEKELVLENIDKRMSGFTSGKVRRAANFKPEDLVKYWNKSFSSNPNAAVSFENDRGTLSEIAVRLGKPTLSKKRITFPIEQTGTHYSGKLRMPSLFIDGGEIDGETGSTHNNPGG